MSRLGTPLPSSTARTRAATGLVAALLTFGSATGIVGSTALGPQPAGAAPAGRAPAGYIEPLTASVRQVVAELTRLDAAVADTRTAAADAAATEVHAEADLEGAEARAERQERNAEALEQERARQVDPPPTDVFTLLGGRHTAEARDAVPDEPADRPSAADAIEEAEASVAAAERDRDEADQARAAAVAELDEYVAAVRARNAIRLAEASRAAPVDPAYAQRLRATEAALAAPVSNVAARQQARAAEDAAAGSGTDGATTPAPAPAPAPLPLRRAGPCSPPARPAPAPLPDPAGAASGRLDGAWCADGSRIVVDSSLGISVQLLIHDAAAAGVGLCGSGFRTYDEQVQLRRQHCGTSDFAVFQAAPSSCSPPTARPGTSNHEDGLAIDFSCADGQPMTHASPCYRWLAANAHNYGLRNLPSEPWHWSVSGT